MHGEETKKETAEEKIKIGVVDSYDNKGKIDTSALNKSLENIEGITDGLPITELPAELTVDGYKVKIDENGKVTRQDEDSKKREMLYDKGTQNISWETPVGNRTSSWYSPKSAIFESDYIKLYDANISSRWISCGIVSSEKVSFDGYSNLCMEYDVVEPTKGIKNGEYIRSIIMQMSGSKKFDYTSSYSQRTSVKGKENAKIDIKDMNDAYYIKIFNHLAPGDGFTYSAFDTDIRITKIYLEE